MHKSRNKVNVILTAYSIIEPFTKNVIYGQTKEQKAQLMSEDSCIFKSVAIVNNKLGVLIALNLVTFASLMLILILNVINRLVNLKAGIKV